MLTDIFTTTCHTLDRQLTIALFGCIAVANAQTIDTNQAYRIFPQFKHGTTDYPKPLAKTPKVASKERNGFFVGKNKVANKGAK